ncbi:DUF4214 domain-containing protein [Aquimixticola soesokkakensis]|uniref:DUF4214 domain-containing protein n=1 Tax=Aquimixticola soesokkakensis TaxID=1519096 RepID=UPI0013562AD7|nr:DUF4214 domain-containing protein [Aquimixticola soesokkakensis]
MAVASNPLFSSQWHFDLIGNIQAVWNDYTGDGITVGIYDTGVEKYHADLNDNYNASLHWSSSYGSDNGANNSSDDSHGTSVAGILASENNGIGGVGVAYDASITSIDFLNDVQFISTAAAIDSMKWAASFDVMNNSWGLIGYYDTSQDVGTAGTFTYKAAGALEYAAKNGRDGLGTIITKASGNEHNNPALETQYNLNGNAQGDGLNNIHEAMVVAATDNWGDVAYYSNWGANVFISAPAPSVTTTTGQSYTEQFGGTSAATPVVSGIAALMLEANETLGWRDVQDIIALTAQATGSYFGEDPVYDEVAAWMSNGASTWNGGGMSYSVSYGYGLIDALAAVRTAEVWSLMHQGAVQTSDNMVTISKSNNTTKNWTQSQTINLNITQNIEVEYAYVTIDSKTQYIQDVTVYLVDPDGNSYLLVDQEGRGSFDQTYTFGVAGLIGTESAGIWKLQFSDSVPVETNTIYSVGITFEGQAISADTIHTITDDFLEFASVETGRETITDTDGGDDWLNLVAVTGNVALALKNNGALKVDNAAWATLANGGQIESAALGDGADRAVGSATDNMLSGGRGGDTLAGGGGHDILIGGQGNDILSGDGISLGDGHHAAVYRIYQAVLNRSPNLAGLDYWAEQLGSGKTTYSAVVNSFMQSGEFTAKYGGVSNEDFVKLLYQNVIHRTPQQSGLDYWTDQLDNETLSRASVVSKFAESAENIGNTFHEAYGTTSGLRVTDALDDVFRIYQAALGRTPDISGIEYWAQQIAQGGSALQVSNQFTSSAEFSAKYGAMNNTDFVSALYFNVLEREGSSSGISYWSSQINSGAKTRAEVVLGFSNSAEFVAKSAVSLASYLASQAADDTLYGGNGNDTLIGGMLADSFVFVSGDTGSKTIVDFDANDTLQMANFGFTTADSFLAFCTQNGDDVVFKKGALQVTLADTDLAAITDDALDFSTPDFFEWL